ncbi:TPA: amino acid ABC transporter ATP-binding protein [Escherichia coli]|nr:amino acid ABC transporter ATP-binding protein [Escherichia coli]HCL8650219.1 amino acid ABC transporter ATP-binding protein [Escherichia coli]HCL8842965.1 amino acid ABC transporter ATP-binding protein [Escherichia coli]HCL9379165.1 amino acid ABC transporter ATP-binding protein [Escherichia coli]
MRDLILQLSKSSIYSTKPHEVLKVMRSLADEGMTMVIVTHEIGFARDVASRLIFIDGGTIAEDGPPDILLNASSNPRLKEFLQHVS